MHAGWRGGAHHHPFRVWARPWRSRWCRCCCWARSRSASPSARTPTTSAPASPWPRRAAPRPPGPAWTAPSVLLETLAPQVDRPAMRRAARRDQPAARRLRKPDPLRSPPAGSSARRADVPPIPTSRGQRLVRAAGHRRAVDGGARARSLSPSEPALLAAERVDRAGRATSTGVVAAVISLKSLRPDQSDPALPRRHRGGAGRQPRATC